MKVVHITPTYFNESSFIGGGERYVTELTSGMAQLVDTTLVSFSSERKSWIKDNLKVEIYPVKYLIKGSKLNPLSFKYLNSIISADVIHIHQINAIISDLGCLAGYLLGKRVFGTDHGGGANFVINQKVPVFKCYTNAIVLSDFGKKFLPNELQKKVVLVKGGIDENRFCPLANIAKENKILYVGRILPHKGINYLIDALRILDNSDLKLTIVGRIYNEAFYQDLKQLAANLPVEFIHDADDCKLLQEYRSAIVTVLPSVNTDYYGNYTPIPELMGFTLLESQACGTPVICTDAGAMHEFVDEGKTGFVVKQNSGEALANALRQFINLSITERYAYQDRCLNWIKPLSWSTVVEKHLETYRGKI